MTERARAPGFPLPLPSPSCIVAPMERVTLVVPCFNEASRLPGDAFVAHTLSGFALELLFVDDGSTDGTAEVLEGLCARAPERLRWFSLPENRGKAEAVRTGVLAALDRGCDRVGYWDADLATPLSELARFCEVLDANPSLDAVFGARIAFLGRRIDRHMHRHMYGRVFATAVSRMLTLDVYDTQCGAKLFRASPVLARVFAEPFLGRWVFDVELLARLIAYYEPLGVDVADRVHELPLTRWHDVAGSKVSLSDAVIAAADLARIARRYEEALRLRRGGRS